MTLTQVLERLEKEADAGHAKTFDHYAISVNKAYGIKLPILRKLAKEIGKDATLSEELWSEGHHECKLLATLVADPAKVTLAQMDMWVHAIYSWDVCDQLCINLLIKLKDRWSLPHRWAPSEEEYVRRAGLVMIVALRIHDKKAEDKDFEQFFPLLKKYATDERNFVKKAVNWAIRELGKRSVVHHPKMITLCHELLEMDNKAATWSARDALRELEGEKVRERLKI